MAPAVLLWDFGDTLVDERWMWRAPPACPEWPGIWQDVMRSHADDWNVGRIGSHEVFAALADRTGLPLEEVRRHARDCCRSITYNESTWRVATEHRMPQAIVTVNPDLFTDEIVGPHGLANVFDTIVVSAAEGTDDKSRLCDIALGRLGFTGRRGDALLIDNRRDLVDAWLATGGEAYWYRGDDQFASDVDQLFA